MCFLSTCLHFSAIIHGPFCGNFINVVFIIAFDVHSSKYVRKRSLHHTHEMNALGLTMSACLSVCPSDRQFITIMHLHNR